MPNARRATYTDQWPANQDRELCKTAKLWHILALALEAVEISVECFWTGIHEACDHIFAAKQRPSATHSMGRNVQLCTGLWHNMSSDVCQPLILCQKAAGPAFSLLQTNISQEFLQQHIHTSRQSTATCLDFNSIHYHSKINVPQLLTFLGTSNNIAAQAKHSLTLYTSESLKVRMKTSSRNSCRQQQ